MPGLYVSETHIHQIKNRRADSPLLGFARVTLNGEFVVTGIRIVEGKFGIFISFPRQLDEKQQKHFNVCYPISKELEKSISDAVVAEYNKS